MLRTVINQRSALDARGSIEYGDELQKTESEQFRLLDDIQEIFKVFEENGISVNDAFLDSETLRTLAEAEDMINHCIQSYLHRTLVDEKLLPLLDLNEPPESTFYGIPNSVAIQLCTMDPKYHIR